MAHHFEDQSLVWVKQDKLRLAGKVLESRFASEGDYDWCRAEVYHEPVTTSIAATKATVQALPKPIQSYKLSRRRELCSYETERGVTLPEVKRARQRVPKRETIQESDKRALKKEVQGTRVSLEKILERRW